MRITIVAFVFGLMFDTSAMAQGSAEAYPNRPLTLVIPFAAGGATDVMSRALADALRSRLGQQVIVESKPGAGGGIANEYVARAAPDGYTMLLGGSSLTMNPAMSSKVPYNPVTDYAPVSMLLTLDMFVVVHPDVPATTLRELIAWLRASPGQYSYGSIGNGSVTHLQMELFKQMTGTHVVHIPYRGTGPAIVDLIGGRIQLMFDSMATSGAQIKNGTVRPIATVMTKRSKLLPDVPTFEEAGLPGYDAVAWTGVLLPAATPPAIVQRLNRAMVEAMQDPTFQKRVENIGGVVTSSTPEQFATKLRSETEKWARLVKERRLAVD